VKPKSDLPFVGVANIALAKGAVEDIEKTLPVTTKPWTVGVLLPGGDFPVDGFDAFRREGRNDHSFLSTRNKRLGRAFWGPSDDRIGGFGCRYLRTNAKCAEISCSADSVGAWG